MPNLDRATAKRLAALQEAFVSNAYWRDTEQDYYKMNIQLDTMKAVLKTLGVYEAYKKIITGEYWV